jgi:hypothetical protein
MQFTRAIFMISQGKYYHKNSMQGTFNLHNK